jgi:hypothetical protein
MQITVHVNRPITLRNNNRIHGVKNICGRGVQKGHIEDYNSILW